MPSYVPPARATAYEMYITLTQQADTKLVQVNPTLAAADFNVSLDGGAFNPLGTTPTVTPAGGAAVRIQLSVAEMTADNVVVRCSDAAGAQWCDLTILLQTSVNQIDTLATQANIGVAGAGLTALGDARLANLDALVSAIPGAVWDELIAAHLNPGSTGEALNNIAGADPWATVLPGAYVAGSAGNIIGNFMTALPPAVAGLVIGVLNNVVCGKVCAPSRVSGSIVDIVMERYTTKQITGMVVDEAGYPYDLTDCNVEWRAGTYLTKSSATLPATITILAPATAGVFQFTITADESKTPPYGARSAGVEHECKVRNTVTGDVHLIFSGRFRIDDTLIESM